MDRAPRAARPPRRVPARARAASPGATRHPHLARGLGGATVLRGVRRVLRRRRAPVQRPGATRRRRRRRRLGFRALGS